MESRLVARAYQLLTLAWAGRWVGGADPGGHAQADHTLTGGPPVGLSAAVVYAAVQSGDDTSPTDRHHRDDRDHHYPQHQQRERERHRDRDRERERGDDRRATTAATTSDDDDPATGVVDVSGPCDEAEHANDPRCTGGTAPRVEDNQRPGGDDVGDDHGDDRDGGRDAGRGQLRSRQRRRRRPGRGQLRPRPRWRRRRADDDSGSRPRRPRSPARTTRLAPTL